MQTLAARPVDEVTDFRKREAEPAAGEDERNALAVAAAVEPGGAVARAAR